MTTGGTPPEQRAKEQLSELAPQFAGPLLRYVRRRLWFYRAIGALSRSDLQPEEVVDETFARASERWSERPSSVPLRRWLRRLARRFIEREIRRIQAERRTTRSLDAPLLTHQPDEEAGQETFTLLDILADPRAPLPEQEAERAEWARYLAGVLSHVPDDWLEAFLLHTIDGLSLEQIAEQEEKPVSEVQAHIHYTETFLKAKLTEALRIWAEEGEPPPPPPGH